MHKYKDPSIQSTLTIILAVIFFVTLLANFGISLKPDYYKDGSNKYIKWVNVESVD